MVANDYPAYVESWEALYNNHQTEVAEACSLLPKVRRYIESDPIFPAP
jgi:hypothetical protein